jgi:hypothetical protein
MAEEVVKLFQCSAPEGGGGEATVPAGSRVVLTLGWGAKNRGLMKDFLQAQTTTISINGGAPVDISDSYGPIEPGPEDGFVSRIHHDSGVTLAAGESLQVDAMLAVSHAVPDPGVIDESTHRPALFRPQEPLAFHCRITASA